MLCRNTSTMYDRTENYTTLSYGNIVKKGNGPICLILFSVYLSITNFLCCCVGVNWNGGSDSEIQKIHVAIFITIHSRPDSYTIKTSLKVLYFTVWSKWKQRSGGLRPFWGDNSCLKIINSFRKKKLCFFNLILCNFLVRTLQNFLKIFFKNLPLKTFFQYWQPAKNQPKS